MTETVHFSIDGEFITDLLRTWFWDEDKSYEKCENFIKTCFQGNGVSDDDLNVITQQILEGRKKLVGVNAVVLEDDGENIRPISLKIEEQRRKIKIQEVKNMMSMNMIDFIDPYCTIKSLNAAIALNENNELHPIKTYEQCSVWFWYADTAINPVYMQPNEPGEGMLIDDYDNTDGGLWLYNYPDVAYDALSTIGCEHTSFDKTQFWRIVYDIIKDDFRFRSKYFEHRNEMYLASLRMKKDPFSKKKTAMPTENEPDSKTSSRIDAVLKFTDEWINAHGHEYNTGNAAFEIKRREIKMINSILRDKTDFTARHENMYIILPDEYENWEGLIAPNCNFYSCDFGGHNAKAYYLMAVYPEKFPNFDYETGVKTLDVSNALDEILEQGWCATRYTPVTGAYIDTPPNKRITSAQKRAILDAKIKHDISVDLSVIE
jgi:hypothetical protein